MQNECRPEQFDDRVGRPEAGLETSPSGRLLNRLDVATAQQVLDLFGLLLVPAFTSSSLPQTPQSMSDDEKLAPPEGAPGR